MSMYIGVKPNYLSKEELMVFVLVVLKPILKNLWIPEKGLRLIL